VKIWPNNTRIKIDFQYDPGKNNQTLHVKKRKARAKAGRLHER
jgi:hypothetical protein